VKPTRRSRLEPIFEAVLEGERAVASLLRRDPGLARARAAHDHLVEAIPHWLYKDDTPLHLAAAGQWTEVALALLDAEGDPNAANRRGATPLLYACDPRPRLGGRWDPASQAATIRLLVERGADVARADRGRATALHRAVRARSVAAVRELLALGARTDSVLKSRGSSPLHLAVQSTGAGGTAGTQREQLEIVELLLHHGADPTAPDATGRTPRDWARNDALVAALRLDRRRALATRQEHG
jgi:uncharacterized protein